MILSNPESSAMVKSRGVWKDDSPRSGTAVQC